MKIKLLILLLFFWGLIGYAQETYKVGNTEYYNNLVYVSTGKPMVKRSATNKRVFLESKGYSELPQGYEIDHIIPLSEGGADDPSNMQLLTINQHKRKTARERKNRSKSTVGTFNYGYYSNSTNSNNGNSFTSNTFSYRKDKKGRLIHKGNGGGEYYYTKSGRKKYVKTKNTPSRNQYYVLNTKKHPPIKTKSRIKYFNSFGEEYFILPTRKKSSTKSNQTKSTNSTNKSAPSRTIRTGPRGGKNYVNSNGNKTYVKSKSTYTVPKSATSRTIHTGPRGGKYYINSNGNKTYVKSKSTYTVPRSTSSRTIHTGSRGGRYYINSNGNKTYVKKKN